MVSAEVRVIAEKHGLRSEPAAEGLVADVFRAMMEPMKRTYDDIERAYYIQRQAIAASCNACDRGSKWEALRLATAVYTMVHDGGGIKSICSQGGIKTNAFVATDYQITQETMDKFGRSTPLLEFERNKRGKGDFVPLCKYYEKRGVFHEIRLMMFREWWEEDIIAFDTKADKPIVYLDLQVAGSPKTQNRKPFNKSLRSQK
jgi:hypothetical protein